MEKEEILANAVYSTEEASKLLGLNQLTVQGLIRKGSIKPVAKAGRKYIIPGSSLLKYLGVISE